MCTCNKSIIGTCNKNICIYIFYTSFFTKITYHECGAEIETRVKSKKKEIPKIFVEKKKKGINSINRIITDRPNSRNEARERRKLVGWHEEPEK